MPRSFRLALTALLLAAAVAGCGPDDPVSSADPPDSGGPGTQAVVTGTVRTPKGGPAAGVMIVPISLDRPAKPVPELVVTTDAKGEYSWTLAPGRYAFVPQKPGSTRQEATLRPGETSIVDLEIP